MAVWNFTYFPEKLNLVGESELEKPTIKQLSTFDLKVYCEFLNYLKSNYKIITLGSIRKTSSPYIVLRHDVDISPLAALKMAEIEHKLGISSTYFILLSSKHYNSHDGKNKAIIRQISQLNHEIGLHYDAAEYTACGENSLKSLKEELQSLSNIVGTDILCISSHAPRGPDSFLSVEGLISADDLSLRDVFVHDSQQIWTVKSLSKLLDANFKKAQLLIHPVLWVDQSERKTRMHLLLTDLLIFLNMLRTTIIRILHSRESCDN